MTKTINPLVQEVINILKQYPKEYSDEVINKILSYDSDVQIRVSGEGSTKTINTQELRELIGKFINGENKVLSTTVY